MTQFDDPNRESLGLEPIWTGAGEPESEPEPEAPVETEPPPEDPGPA